MAKQLFEEEKDSKSNVGDKIVTDFKESINALNSAESADDVATIVNKLLKTDLPEATTLEKINSDNLRTALKGYYDVTQDGANKIKSLAGFNKAEQSLLDGAAKNVASAKQAIVDAEKNLEEKKAVADTFFNKLFGTKARGIKNAESSLNLAQDAFKNAQDKEVKIIEKVATMKDQRIAEAQGNELSLMLVDAANNSQRIIEEKLEENEKVTQTLQVIKEETSKLLVRASQLVSTREEDRDKVREEYQKELGVLNGIKDRGSVEFTTQNDVVTQVKTALDHAESKLRVAEAVYKSKEFHLPHIMIRLEGLIGTSTSMKSLAKTLESDIQSMIPEIEAEFEILKSMRIVEAGSLAQKIGVEMTLQNAEVVMASASAVLRDEVERNQLHPEKVQASINQALAFGEVVTRLTDKLDRLRSAVGLEEKAIEVARQRAEDGQSSNENNLSKATTQKPTSSVGEKKDLLAD